MRKVGKSEVGKNAQPKISGGQLFTEEEMEDYMGKWKREGKDGDSGKATEKGGKDEKGREKVRKNIKKCLKKK